MTPVPGMEGDGSGGRFAIDMLTGISAFQLHQSPAWDEARTFDERIGRLPLYALEFNNHDRDNKRHGPTIAHFAPDRREMIALANTIRSIGSSPRVLDIGCGNGFIGSLLAREGVSVTGIDDHSWRQPQIAHFYDPQLYSLRAPQSLEDFNDHFDVAFCSWMLPDSNLTPLLVARKPALIIHIYTPHLEGSGRRQTGTDAAYMCPEGYRRLGAWATLTPENFFWDILPDPIRKIADTRIVETWCRDDVEDAILSQPTELETANPYHWDAERNTLNAIRLRRGLAPFEIRMAPTTQIPSLFPPLTSTP